MRMASSLVKTISAKPVKPILSTSAEEAKRNVINLYRAWCREVSAEIFQVTLV